MSVRRPHTPTGRAAVAAAALVAGLVGAVPARAAEPVVARTVVVAYRSPLPDLAPGRLGPGRADLATAGRLAAAYAGDKRRALERVGPGARVVREFAALPVSLVRVDDARALERLRSAPGVVSVSAPQTYEPADAVPSQALIRAPEAAAAGYTGAGSTVAVLDTGIDPGALASGEFGDCRDGVGHGGCRVTAFEGLQGAAPIDVDGAERHGSNVAGIIAATAPDASLHVYDVFRADGTGSPVTSDTDILAALDRIAAAAPTDHVRAVNLSLQQAGRRQTAECTDSPYSAAFTALRALGVVPVVAAGNSAYAGGGFAPGVSAPACSTGAVRVGAVYSAADQAHSFGGEGPCSDAAATPDTVACFSQTGPLLSLLAPGVSVTAGGSTLTGTSQAAPHVAGAVAALASSRPDASAAQIVAALTGAGPAVLDPRAATRTPRLDIVAAVASLHSATHAVADLPGCRATVLPAGTAASSAAVPLPTALRYFGRSWSAVVVDTDGQVRFVPVDGAPTAASPSVAVFASDADTARGGSVSYGPVEWGSRSALCVRWDGLRPADGRPGRDSMQLMLVDRSDTGAGNSDLVLDYDELDWAGPSADPAGLRPGGTLPGAVSLSAGRSPAGLLDTSPAGLVTGSRGSLQPGRYVLALRADGRPAGDQTLSGGVVERSASVEVSPLGSGVVSACPVRAGPGAECVVGRASPAGDYRLDGLPEGTWRLTAWPPAGVTRVPAVVQAATDGDVAHELALRTPTAPTSATTWGGVQTSAGLPRVPSDRVSSLTTHGCADGTGSYQLLRGPVVLAAGELSGSPGVTGTFAATVPALGVAGPVEMRVALDCPDAGASLFESFDAELVLPAVVRDGPGSPVPGAAVTLQRSDSATGPFTAVSDGSDVFGTVGATASVTGPDGAYVVTPVSGYYRLAVTRTDCTPALSATSPVFAEPVAGLTVTLDCDASDPVAPQFVVVDPVPPTAVGTPGEQALLEQAPAPQASAAPAPVASAPAAPTASLPVSPPPAAATRPAVPAAPVRLTASPLALTRSGPSVALTWASRSVPGARYALSFRTFVPGSRSWTGWRGWLGSTTRSAGIFGAGGRPVRPMPGATYEFRAHALNPAAGAGSVARWTVPFDDGWAGLRYSSGWSLDRRAGGYGPGSHVARGAGREVTAVVPGAATLQLVGRRDRVGGGATVFVDGRRVGRFRTASAVARSGQVLFRIRLAPGRHVLRLVTTGATTCRTALDAISLLPPS